MLRRHQNQPAKKRVDVLGASMAYHDVGGGRPIVFIHGNPTSSYLWRTVVPRVQPWGRCIVPDLIGMGDSAKVGHGPRSYRFIDHATYLGAFLEVVGVEKDVVIVGHDWGGALGLDWASRHPLSVAGIAYMETFVTPLTWDDWPAGGRGIFQAMRSPAGEELILDKNVFVERVMPASVIAPLSDEVMAEYRRPFLQPGEGRRPMLTWPREIPIDGEPAAIVEAVSNYSEFMATSTFPKLFVNASPGSILVGRQREVCRNWPNQVEVTVDGIHFIQEDSGEIIGDHLASWVATF